jgi:hypothetical protein
MENMEGNHRLPEWASTATSVGSMGAFLTIALPTAIALSGPLPCCMILLRKNVGITTLTEIPNGFTSALIDSDVDMTAALVTLYMLILGILANPAADAMANDMACALLLR